MAKKIRENWMIDTEQNREKLLALSGPLLAWYGVSARRLPWRADREAYDIWVSEIMLQQTRVEAVKRYYRNFMTGLPTIRKLAECPEDQLLKFWEGLGYYNRVRNMQKAARVLMDEYEGTFPADYDAIRKLPGIGSYTAGAIASIAFGIPEPAVDGNVLRVLMRVLGNSADIAKPSVREETEALVRYVLQNPEAEEGPDAWDPGIFNQALMEMGACVCVPAGPPGCGSCPLAGFCEAFRNGNPQDYPVKAPPKERRIEDRTVLVIRDGHRAAVFKRPPGGLLAGLYEFKNTKGTLDRKEVLGLVEQMGLTPLYIEELPPARHIFTHVEWHMTGWRIQVAAAESDPPGGCWADIEAVKTKLAIPSAFAAYKQYL